MDLNLPDFYRSLANINPRAAYFLLRQGNWIKQTYRITFAFTSGAPDVNYAAYLDEPMGEDFLVLDMRSTVRRPNAFAGSVFKAQSDVANAQNSGIDVLLRTQGGNPGAQYVINGSATPLELVAPPIASATVSTQMCGWVLGHMQTVKAEFILRRTLASDEIPTEVSIIFTGARLGCQMYNGMSVEQARQAIKAEWGI